MGVLRPEMDSGGQNYLGHYPLGLNIKSLAFNKGIYLVHEGARLHVIQPAQRVRPKLEVGALPSRVFYSIYEHFTIESHSLQPLHK